MDMDDALFGGRTEVFRVMAWADEEWALFYKDFVSLYPTCLKVNFFYLKFHSPC